MKSMGCNLGIIVKLGKVRKGVLMSRPLWMNLQDNASGNREVNGGMINSWGTG